MSNISDKEIREVMWNSFPKKEDGYREYQEEAILNVVKTWLSGKKFAILEAPTGSGKSVLAYTALRTIHHFDAGYREDPETHQNVRQYKGPYGLINVHTRALQLQYAGTFPDVPNIWSGTHYTCAVEPMNKDFYWGCGECVKKRCIQYDNCDYANTLIDFLQSDLGITNYAYYLHAPFLRPFVSVIDECHNLETILCDYSKVELSTRFLTQMLLRLLRLDLVTAPIADSIQKLIRSIIFIDDRRGGWLKELRRLAEVVAKNLAPLYIAIDSEIRDIRSSYDNPKLLTAGQRAHLQFLERASRYFRNLIEKLRPISLLETEWIISSQEHEENKEGKIYPKVDIKPLYIHEVSNSKLFRHSRYFLFMSATVGSVDIFTKYLGIEKERVAFFQVPSTFPVENRPVRVYTDLGAFTYAKRETFLPHFTGVLDDILTGYFPNVRGIVHSTSYENAEYIQQHSTQVARMSFPHSADLLEVISLLKEKEDRVIVSPSVMEGLDLVGDLCRFQIFFKIPWKSLGEKWTKERSKDGEWYSSSAVVSLIQGSGRGTRDKNDYSVTIVMDNLFLRLWKQHKKFFPSWYTDAVQFITYQGEAVTL